MSRPILPPGIIPLGATHFYFDPARIKPATNPWRRLDSDGTWHMLVGSQWNRIAASRRHMFVAVTDGVPAERVAHVELASESLTLRDEFAKSAPISFEQVMMLWGDDGVDLKNETSRKCFYAVWASLRYEFADDMLKAREVQS